MLDTHSCFISLYCFAWSAAAVDVGAQEREIPDADHRNVKIPDAFYNVGFSPFDQE